MQSLAGQLQNIISDYYPQLKKISEEGYAHKPAPNKWSKKEILGHLADSAQNNIRRFIVAQYEEQPFIVYNQDQWVAISNYQHYKTSDLIELWALLNKHICIILSNTSDASAQKTCATNNMQLHSIQWLAVDYIKHLRHHLHQVLDMEPVAYP